MSAKWGVSDIVSAHFDTLRDATTGKWRFRDYLGLLGIPLVVAVAAVVFHLKLYDVSKLLGGISVFTALLFGMVGNVFTLFIRVRRDERLSPYDSLIADVRELFANVSWSVLVGLGLTTSMVIASSTQAPAAPGKTAEPLGSAWAAVLTFLFVHLVMCVLMALNRLWLAHTKIADLPPKS
ncbi:hypothetical protein [Nocardioides alkalitolerans]|uniref:hypothetical protein n=1 Tax=Nocardioides alkalitolerans TaxID=281714 RepID=UPI00049113CC|nr:hypothetical protein [Nocardioides alkalitolerans]